MRHFFFWILPTLLCADFDSFFTGDDDPSIVHHVNVITGNLQLSFQDLVAEGALSIPLNRSYSSGGALESLNEHRLLKLLTQLVPYLAREARRNMRDTRFSTKPRSFTLARRESQ